MNLTTDQITIVRDDGGDTDGSTAYVVAEGEEAPSWAGGQTVAKVPPAWMTATCETCVIPPEMMGAFVVMDQSACPDCLNGKPIHTFDVECPRCRIADERVCPVPGCSGRGFGKLGTVSYRLAVREVLPVLHQDHGDGVPPHLCVRDNGRYVVVTDGSYEVLSTFVWPAAKPGMYLAICEVVK
jgi:hypothetical protein